MVALGRLENPMFTLVTLCVGSIAFGTTRANESTGISRVAIVAGIADTVGLLDRSSRGGRKRRTILEKYIACSVFERINWCFLTQL